MSTSSNPPDNVPPHIASELNAMANQYKVAIVEIAHRAMEFAEQTGVGPAKCAAFRSSKRPELACVCLLAVGPFPDADLAALRDAFLGMVQDTCSGKNVHVQILNDINNAKHSEGGSDDGR